MTKRILTGLTPSATQLHIGNYFGCLKQIIDRGNQNNEDEIFLFIPNMHSLISKHDGEFVRTATINIVKTFIAAGADINKYFIYNQSDIVGHAQLHRVLTCMTHMGYMERMHAFKDKAANGKANEASVGLFTYPILMAADILLYDANLIPVGKDQQQHVEFARDIATKFNNKFGDTFTIPDFAIAKDVAVVPGIDGRKMSKSYNNFIGLLDDEKTLKKKIKQIATASLSVEEPKDPDACNVYNILKLLLNEQENQEIRAKYTAGGLSYKVVKEYLYDKLSAFLQPLQENFNKITDVEVIALLAKNALRANAIAEKKMKDVYAKVGFTL